MRFSGARLADEQHWLGPLNPCAFSELMDARCRDQWRLPKIKLLQCLHSGQLRFEYSPQNRVSVAFLYLGRKQCFQIPDRSLLLFYGVISKPRELTAYGRQMQLPAVLPDAFTPQRVIGIH